MCGTTSTNESSDLGMTITYNDNNKLTQVSTPTDKIYTCVWIKPARKSYDAIKAAIKQEDEFRQKSRDQLTFED